MLPYRRAGFMLAVGAALCAKPAEAQDNPIGILLAAGDIAKCNPASGRDEATAAVIKQAVDDASSKNIPVHVLVLGDLAYDHGTQEEFECFNESWGAFKQVMLPVPGNHDYGNPPGRDAAPYFAYFSDNSLVAQNGAKAGYYSTNFPDAESGPWRLVGLNTYARTEGGWAAELAWLENDLAANSIPCVLAFSHPFFLSSGHHGHADGDSAQPVTGSLMRKAFRVLHEHGATALISGHDHNFEQFARHDDTGNRTDDGVRSFVVGTGGGRLYHSEQTSRWPASEFYDDTRYGVLKISLYPDRYSWAFLPIEGSDEPDLPVREDRCRGS